jgi:hypothetical protein
MSVSLRTVDELRGAPALATLPALSTCIEAFLAALGVAHPSLLATPRSPSTPRETAALLLHMQLDACQHLLREYDQITFDETSWHSSGTDDEAPPDPEDDIPF